ncbi:isopeptide-forming domain-containing fimbrial protein [Galactobacter valiniphilus]|uniref:Isopeptide-forming domain-containing fimbrial protein n=1 Tax=Galactobacter valiniphilus TaxID=2676122 RepID=A0A399J731_9MICC|nr:SpaH/EbpB family LPXTG-anchored major pilin [Galactobacter valiniphilus]RII41278.1 isopeptide-forming domain-containing fimbrial protein [Galactobacter valiniphilus]
MKSSLHRRNRGLRGTLAALGAAVLGSALALGTAAPAHAAQNIDPNAKGSITVHKFEEPVTPTGLAHDGTQQTTAGLTPIQGVTFQVQKVNVDLTDSTKWQGLENYTVAQAQANLTGTPTSVVTDAAGTAAFPNLTVGLYLVTETAAPSKVVQKSAPFLVTIPLSVKNDWLYDVHAYPKNTVSSVSKAIDDTKANIIGDPISFTLTAKVPNLPAAQALTAFGFVDTIDSRLTYQNATVTVAGLTLAAADYTITAGPNFKVDFSASGLAKLKTVQGADVKVVINTVINSIGDGTIKNKTQLYVNDPKNLVDSNEVSTPWGALKITKVQKADTTKTLAGAEFEIYATDAAGNKTGNALVNPKTGTTKFTTGTDGTVSVDGLKVGKYIVIETKAPLGYKLDSTQRPVTIVAGSTATPVQLQVTNDQVPPFELPLTGSTGIALFVGVGVALIAASFLLAAVRRRQQRA